MRAGSNSDDNATDKNPRRLVIGLGLLFVDPYADPYDNGLARHA